MIYEETKGNLLINWNSPSFLILSEAEIFINQPLFLTNTVMINYWCCSLYCLVYQSNCNEWGKGILSVTSTFNKIKELQSNIIVLTLFFLCYVWQKALNKFFVNIKCHFFLKQVDPLFKSLVTLINYKMFPYQTNCERKVISKLAILSKMI